MKYEFILIDKYNNYTILCRIRKNLNEIIVYND